jgi:redox-sensing transcriptional repressor
MLANEIQLTTSEHIAEELGVSAALVRKDLSHLGQLGTQGHGYEIVSVLEAMKSALGLDRVRDVAIIGFGSLGQAIARHLEWDTNSFRVVAAFDISDALVGKTVNGVKVHHVRDSVRTLREQGIKIGIVAVPSVAAQSTVELLTRGGVSAILNYSSMITEKPGSADVIDFDPCLALSTLSYQSKM